MTSCVDIREELKAYADGELAGSLRNRVRLHIEGCAACGRELEEIKSLSRTLRELDTAVPRPELRSRILAELPEEVRPERRAAPWWRMPSFALGTAAAALLIFVLAAPRASKMPEDLAAVRDQAASSPAANTGAGEKQASPAPTEPATGAAAQNKSRTPAKSTAAPTVPHPSDMPGASAVQDRAVRLTPGTLPSPAMRPAAPAVSESLAAPSPDRGGVQAGKPLSELPAEKRQETPLGSAKADAAAGLRSAPGQPGGLGGPAGPQGPQGAAGGFGAGGPQAPAPLAQMDGTAAKVQSRNLSVMPNALGLSYERTETLEVIIPEVEEAANGIIAAVQDEGGKPLPPEKQADPGAPDVTVTLLVPASKVDELKSRLSDSGSPLQLRETKDLYRYFGAVPRQRVEQGVKNQNENRAFLGYLAPQDKAREAVGQQTLGALQRDNKRSQQDQSNLATEQEANRKAPVAGGAGRATLLGKAQAPAARPLRAVLKKQPEEMVRLIVKLRTAPAQAPAAAKKKTD